MSPERLIAAWRAATHGMGPLEACAHESYHAILRCGPAVIPAILADYMRADGHWHVALAVLTGESPVRPGEITDTYRTRAAWLRWGLARGLLDRAVQAVAA